MAGTSHADAYTFPVGLNDIGDGTGAVTMFQYMRSPTNPFGCTSPINAGPHHWIMQAAFHSLDNWVRTGDAPPIAPLLEVDVVLDQLPWVVLNRDTNGNALGGVRSPHVDVPVATLDSVNGGLSFCRLFGRTIPLPAATIETLYVDKTDFTTRWLNSINTTVAAGFMRPADTAALAAAAEAWDFPD
jgi:hypothetical protein